MSPTPADSPALEDEDLAAARAEVRSTARAANFVAVGAVVLLYFASVSVALVLAPDASRATTMFIGAGVATVIAIPLMMLLSYAVTRRRIAVVASYIARGREVLAASREREFATRVQTALEMSETEADALDTLEHVLEALDPQMPAELLLADNSHAHLRRLAVSRASEEPPGCPVTSPEGCVAARRAQSMVFADSREFDVCPKLRARRDEPISAVCVPVSIMGRSVGVLHGVAPLDSPPGTEVVAGLQLVADQLGTRMGMLRAMSETQLQAATDSLTGLLNRRSLESGVRTLSAAGRDYAVAVADLDSFKALNDRHGHETGDRALRLFTEVLRAAVRTDDLVCRFGGEEFVVVLPDTSLADAVGVMERVREDLARRLVSGRVPAFTVSFGVTGSLPGRDLAGHVEAADELLFVAKRAGGDCVRTEADRLDGALVELHEHRPRA